MSDLDLVEMVSLKLSNSDSITSRQFFVLRSAIRLGCYYVVKSPKKGISVGYLIWRAGDVNSDVTPNYIGDFCTGETLKVVDFCYLPGWRSYCLEKISANNQLQDIARQIVKRSIRHDRFRYLSNSH